MVHALGRRVPLATATACAFLLASVVPPAHGLRLTPHPGCGDLCSKEFWITVAADDVFAAPGRSPMHGASDAVFAQAGKTVGSPQHSVLGASTPAPETQAPTVQEALDTLTEALTIARAVTNNRVRAVVLGRIAEALGETGDVSSGTRIFSESLAAARGIPDNRQRTEALRGIARAQAKAGDLPGAIATVRSISDEAWRAVALHGIAEARARVGDFGGALAIARSMPDGPIGGNREGALSAIARAQAKAGDFDGALTTARGISAPKMASTLSDIAQAQAKAGDIAGALATVQDIDAVLSSTFKLKALLGIAEIQA